MLFFMSHGASKSQMQRDDTMLQKAGPSPLRVLNVQAAWPHRMCLWQPGSSSSPFRNWPGNLTTTWSSWVGKSVNRIDTGMLQCPTISAGLIATEKLSVSESGAGPNSAEQFEITRSKEGCATATGVNCREPRTTKTNPSAAIR